MHAHETIYYSDVARIIQTEIFVRTRPISFHVVNLAVPRQWYR